MKKPTKKKLWTIFSIFIRMRDCLKTTGSKDWGLCVTCGKRYHFKMLQAGHFVPGRHNAGLFSEKGTHAQCYYCNITLKGNTLVYRRKIVEMYGEGADLELEKEMAGTLQLKTNDILEKMEHYKQKIKELEEQNKIPVSNLCNSGAVVLTNKTLCQGESPNAKVLGSQVKVLPAPTKLERRGNEN